MSFEFVSLMSVGGSGGFVAVEWERVMIMALLVTERALTRASVTSVGWWWLGRLGLTCCGSDRYSAVRQGGC